MKDLIEAKCIWCKLDIVVPEGVLKVCDMCLEVHEKENAGRDYM